MDDAETRKYAVKALGSITKTIGINAFNAE